MGLAVIRDLLRTLRHDLPRDRVTCVATVALLIGIGARAMLDVRGGL